MNRWFSIVLAASSLTFATVASGCGGDQTCSDNRDCFAGEVCSLGLCERPGVGNAMSGDGGMSATDSSNPNGSSNSGTINASNTQVGRDAGSDASPPDASPDIGPDMGRSDVCIVNPFDVSCEADGNDRSSESIQTSTAGCLTTSDSDFKSMDTTVSALLCSLEERDRYSQAYGECREKSFVTEVRLTPKSDCDPADIDFQVSMQGKSCADQDESPDIVCSVEPDGSFFAQIVVRPSPVPSINLLRIVVEPTRENVHFEYDLNVVMR